MAGIVNNALVWGEVYNAHVRGSEPIEARYMGKKRYYLGSPVRHLVISRDPNQGVIMTTFTRFNLKGRDLTMKHALHPSLSKSEKQHLEEKLTEVGL